MATIEINGGNVVYEILGDSSAPLIVLTPGGRFGKEIPGLRPLADALVEGGLRVLLWDRPNCGESDVQFYGVTESHMRAETLHGLLTALEEGPCIPAGGSGGARDSMLTAMLYPELASKLIVWHIVGGVYSTMNLGALYILPTIMTLRSGQGIEGVLQMGEWNALISANPKNRQRILDIGADGLQRVMMRWLTPWVPKPGMTIPGVDDWMFDRIQIPTLIIRGGENDVDHPKRTSLEVSCLIKGSKLIEPPWPEDAWERAMEATLAGTGDLFGPWVKAAPAILDFVGE
jgi:2-hydroxy-6-oxonona-2,4-dienedioate hydrolase